MADVRFQLHLPCFSPRINNLSTIAAVMTEPRYVITATRVGNLPLTLKIRLPILVPAGSARPNAAEKPVDLFAETGGCHWQKVRRNSNKLFHNGIGLNTARHGYRLGDSGVAEPPAALDRAHTHHLVFRLRYPLTLFFGLVIILILGISSGFLISRAASGANDQLIRTLEAEIEEDLTRDLERLRRSGVDISIDPQVSDGLLDTWIAEVSRDIGASVAVLFDLDGMPVWSSDPAHGGSGDFEAKDVDIALARGVVTEMVRNVQLVDADGRYYISDAMETYLPLFNASGDAEIGVLEVYVDVRDELAAAGRAARTNISNVVIEVMVAVGLSLIGTVFIVELLLNRARRMQLE